MENIYGPPAVSHENDASPVKQEWTGEQVIKFLRDNLIGAIEKEAVQEQLEGMTGIEFFMCVFWISTY